MTRYGEISPLWQKKSILQNVEPAWQNFGFNLLKFSWLEMAKY